MVARIRQLLELRQLTPTQFADRIGVGRPVVSHILSERNKPSLEVALHIRRAFPEISLEWLLEGTGDMLGTGGGAPAGPSAAPPARSSVPRERKAAIEPAPAQSGRAPVAPAAPMPAPSQAPSQAPSPVSPRPGLAATAVSSAASAAANPLRSLRPDETPVLAASAPSPLAASGHAPIAVSLPIGAGAAAMATGSAPADLSPLAFLGEPGKAIRRIVIFYRDGSFSDYLPEQ